MAVILQTPQIIEVLGSTIRVAHPDISLYPSQVIAEKFQATATSLLVKDNEGFADTDKILLGPIGSADTEVATINAAVTRGQTIPIANTTKFGHTADAPVNLLKETSIKIYGSASLTDTPILIATVNIQWGQQFTSYTDIVGTYNYYTVKFSDGTTDSE